MHSCYDQKIGLKSERSCFHFVIRHFLSFSLSPASEKTVQQQHLCVFCRLCCEATWGIDSPSLSFSQQGGIQSAAAHSTAVFHLIRGVCVCVCLSFVDACASVFDFASCLCESLKPHLHLSFRVSHIQINPVEI